MGTGSVEIEIRILFYYETRVLIKPNSNQLDGEEGSNL